MDLWQRWPTGRFYNCRVLSTRSIHITRPCFVEKGRRHGCTTRGCAYHTWHWYRPSALFRNHLRLKLMMLIIRIHLDIHIPPLKPHIWCVCFVVCSNEYMYGGLARNWKGYPDSTRRIRRHRNQPRRRYFLIIDMPSLRLCFPSPLRQLQACEVAFMMIMIWYVWTERKYFGIFSVTFLFSIHDKSPSLVSRIMIHSVLSILAFIILCMHWPLMIIEFWTEEVH